MEYLESCIKCGALQLVGHKIDKKKERAISFAMKQVRNFCDILNFLYFFISNIFPNIY